MSRLEKSSRLRLLRSLSIVSAVTLLMGCNSLTKPSPTVKNPLIISSCPELTPLADDSFGATVLKLADTAKQYYKCREAALADRVE